MVDDGLAETVRKLGGQRQNAGGLVDIGEQIDDDGDALLEGVGVVMVLFKQSERIGIVGRMLEQIFGRRIAAERRIEREHAEIRR